MATGTTSLVRSARSLIGLQLLSRLVTFSLNQVLIRITSAQVFGIANIQFDFIRDTILFLSREGARNVIPRYRPQYADERTRSQVKGLFQTSGILSLAVTALVLPLYLYFTPASTQSQPCFYSTLALYVIATLTETVFVEPRYLHSLVASDEPDLRLRVKAEGAAVIARAILTTSWMLLVIRHPLGIGLGLHLGPRHALLAFAVGQVGYSVTLALVFSRKLYKDNGRAVSKKSKEKDSNTSAITTGVNAEAVRLISAFTAQSVFKHLLTEGDRLVVAWASPLEDQGGYALATNYASLVARIIFQPLEESSRIYFLSSKEPMTIFSLLVRASVFFGLMCPAFVPPLAPVILPYLVPKQYRATSAMPTLTAYLSAYLPVLSLNGILESFFAATSGVRGIGQQSGVMIGCSAAFAGTLLFCDSIRAGHSTVASRMSHNTIQTWINPETSLVYANCIQMLCRIVFAGNFALRHAKGGLSDAGSRESSLRFIPSLVACIAVLVSGSALRRFVDHLGSSCWTLAKQGVAVGLGGASAMICIVIL